MLYINKELVPSLKVTVAVFTNVSPYRSTIYSNDNDHGIDILNNKLASIVSDLPAVNVFIAGDLNARVKDLKDYIVHDDVDFIHGIDSNYPNDHFDTPRSNKDKCSNRFGHSLIYLCCTYSIHMLNGRFPGDANGEFTCVANDGKSTVDYILVSTDLIDTIHDFSVVEKDVSDHFPLQCTISCNRDNEDLCVQDATHRMSQSL